MADMAGHLVALLRSTSGMLCVVSEKYVGAMRL